MWPNGDRYTGDFAEGVKNGNGILYFANGDKRVGGGCGGGSYVSVYVW